MKRLDKLEEIKTPGAKNDADKLRYDLADDLADEALIAVMTFGANKYTPNGWREVQDAFDRYYGALRRHAREFRRFLKTRDARHRFDEETGFPHTAQMLCNVYFLCALDLATHQPDFDGTKAAAEALRRWEAIKRSKMSPGEKLAAMGDEMRAAFDRAFNAPTLTGKAKSGRAGGLASAKARAARRNRG